MRKRNIIIGILLGALLSIAVILPSVAENPTTAIMKKWGTILLKNSKSDKEKTISDIVYKGENATITKKQIEQAVDFYMLTGSSREMAEEQAVQHLKEYEALYQEAIKNGYTVTDDEVRAYIEELKQMVEIADNKEDVKEVINQFESEEDYWEYEFTVYQKSLPIQKYVKAMEQDFANLTGVDIHSSDGNERWRENFEDLKRKLVEAENFSLVENK